MKLPKLKKPARSRDSRAKLELPAPLKGLWEDLESKRLLVPVIALIAAIVAVPLLLGGSSTPPVTGGSPLVPSVSGAERVEAAVLAEQNGIRDYRKRLEALRAKNPFDQQFQISENPDDGTVPVEEGSAEISIGSQDPAATSTGTVDPVTGATGSSPSVSTTAPGQTSPPDNVDPAEPGVTFFAGVADVTVGPQGETENLDDLRPVTALPSKQDPVVAFIGLSNSLKSAYFVVSDSVVRTSGDGRCTPKELEGCQVLELGVGDERLLTVGGTETGAEAPRAKVEAEAVGADGASDAGDQARSAGSGSGKAEAVTYRLKVRSIDVIEVDDPRAK